METETGEVRVAKIEERKEMRREGVGKGERKEKEENTKKGEDNGIEEGSRRMGDLG